MNSLWKRLSPWAFFVVVVGLLVSTFHLQSQRKNVGLEMSYSNFLSQLHDGRVHDVTMAGHEIIGHFNDNRSFQTYSPPHTNLSERLLNSPVEIMVRPESTGARLWWNILTVGLPMCLIAVWAYLRHLSQIGTSGGIRSTGLGKSKAKLLTEMSGKVTFADVAGVDEAMADLQEIVEFLREPGKFQRLGGRIPRGVLLVGPPGTGKTLLARAIAGEAEIPFFLISGSDFVEMFVGVGASRVRDMFEQAKKSSPCIIFIDEIDAVGRRRGAGVGGGNDEREPTLNQLLVEMDGFEANEGIILIAATNRPDVLDPALMPPGRLDRQITMANPDFIGREKILIIHAGRVPLGTDVDLNVVARSTPGFSGADLMNLVNEAALLAARRLKRIVTNQEFEDARDKIMMSAERRTLSMTEEEKKLTAYHDGGHALVQLTVPGAMPIHKATIIPRGRALGMVEGLPERDQVPQTYEQLTAMLAIAMGGRVAEELIFGHDKVTSGAAPDIQQCTWVARAMITQLGFSDKLGTVAYAEPQQEQFLGYSLGRQQSLSEATQQTIDAEVRRLVQEAYDKARDILTEKRAQLDAIANGLLEFETLTGEEMKGVLQGRRPMRRSMDVASLDDERPNFDQLVGSVPGTDLRRRHAAFSCLSRQREVGLHYIRTNRFKTGERGIMMRALLAFVTAMWLNTAIQAQQVTGGPIQQVQQCVTKIGPNVLTFTFYQPLKSRNQFCEEIPETGPTIIVIDSMQDELRDMTMELRVMKSAGNADIEMVETNQSVEVNLPPAKFTSGTLTYEHNFSERGSYIAFVRAKGPNGSKEYNATFAFTVGETSVRELVATLFLTVSAFGGFWLWYRRKFVCAHQNRGSWCSLEAQRRKG